MPLRRWFGDLPDGERLDPSLRELVGGIAKALDRLRPPAVASGSVFVVPDVPAVVVPHARIPGCSLVLQVSDWSSSVGCWWSERADPRQGPPTLELSEEFPLEPDGVTRAVAWLAQELRRPLIEQVRRYGVVCRRDWLVVLEGFAGGGVRHPVHLVLSMLRLGLGFLAGSTALPSGNESALRTLGMFLRGWWPDLLGVAALGCFLIAFLGMPGSGSPRHWWPRVLPVAVLVCLADLAAGLRWLVPASGAGRTLMRLGALVVAGRAVAVAVAIALLLVVLDRPAGMTARAVRAGVAGGVLLVVAWGNMVAFGLARLAELSPAPLAHAIVSASFGLALFAGTALVAFAAAKAPAAPSQPGGTAPSVPRPRARTRDR